MIEIRIRHEGDTKATRLMDWPADRLDEVVPLLGAWGVVCDYGNFDATELSGGFVIQDGRAFFEVLISVDEA